MTERLTPRDIVEVWKNVIEVQKHFNTIEMTVRNIFATLVVALIAGIGFAVRESVTVTVGMHIRLETILCIAAMVISALFYFIDRFWYHRLLLGSVAEATRLEEEISKISDIPVRLSQEISRLSPWHPPRVLRFFLWPLISEPKFRETGKIHSDGKIELFYKSIMLLFLVLAVLTHFTIKVPIK